MGRKKIKRKRKVRPFEYRCDKCPHTWKTTENPGECPVCGSLYYTWTNYGEFEIDSY